MADHGWLVILWVVSTPIFLATLGPSDFGLMTLVNAVIGLGGVVSLGLGEATIRQVARALSEDNEARARRSIETVLVLYLAVSLVTALALAAAAPAIATHVFGLGENRAAGVAALRLAAAALVVQAFLKTYEAALGGAERFDLTATLGIVTRSVVMGVNLLLAWLGFGVPALFVILLAGLSGQAIAAARLVARHAVSRVRPLALPDPRIATQALGLGLRIWAQIASEALANTADRFLVGAILGPAAAGIYAVILQLSQQGFILLYRGLAFLMPMASAAAVKGGARLDDTYRLGLVAAAAVSATAFIPLCALGPQILRIWVGPELATSGAVPMRLLLTVFLIWSAIIVPLLMLNGAGRPGWASWAFLVHGLGVVAAAGPLLALFGLTGAPLARLAFLPAVGIAYVGLLRILPGPGARRLTALYALSIAAIAAIGLLLASIFDGAAPLAPGGVLGITLGLAFATALLCGGLALAFRPKTGPKLRPSPHRPVANE